MVRFINLYKRGRNSRTPSLSYRVVLQDGTFTGSSLVPQLSVCRFPRLCICIIFDSVTVLFSRSEDVKCKFHMNEFIIFTFNENRGFIESGTARLSHVSVSMLRVAKSVLLDSHVKTTNHVVGARL